MSRYMNSCPAKRGRDWPGAIESSVRQQRHTSHLAKALLERSRLAGWTDSLESRHWPHFAIEDTGLSFSSYFSQKGPIDIDGARDVPYIRTGPVPVLRGMNSYSVTCPNLLWLLLPEKGRYATNHSPPHYRTCKPSVGAASCCINPGYPLCTSPKHSRRLRISQYDIVQFHAIPAGSASQARRLDSRRDTRGRLQSRSGNSQILHPAFSIRTTQ